jgi:hypothetical protein
MNDGRRDGRLAMIAAGMITLLGAAAPALRTQPAPSPAPTPRLRWSRRRSWPTSA